MELIKWSDKLSMGMEDIDKQHKGLVEVINKAYTLSTSKDKNSKKNVAAVEEILSSLVEYVRVHFSTEEEYFEKFNYPFANEHMIEHEMLVIEVLKFKDRYAKEGIAIVPDLAKFLKSWLDDHLVKQDGKYAKYFKEHGYI